MKYWKSLVFSGIALMLLACGGPQKNASGSNREGQPSGEVVIDGSSTVYPITEAVAEEFGREYPDVQVHINVSGTGGGFKKFIRGEIDINNASRPIRPGELEALKKAGFEAIELRVGIDGIAVVVHPENDWMDTTTIAELAAIWAPESEGKVTQWNHVRPSWPDQTMTLYGPGTASGTFDYFTERVMGESGRSRGDYIASEDDNQLVIGIEGDRYALGYFGMAYYLENKGKLRAVPVADQGTAVPLSPENVQSGRYPLSRPLFIYVRKDALKRPEVKAFVRFYLEHAGELVPQVGYVPLSPETYQEQLKQLP